MAVIRLPQDQSGLGPALARGIQSFSDFYMQNKMRELAQQRQLAAAQQQAEMQQELQQEAAQDLAQRQRQSFFQPDQQQMQQGPRASGQQQPSMVAQPSVQDVIGQAGSQALLAQLNAGTPVPQDFITQLAAQQFQDQQAAQREIETAERLGDIRTEDKLQLFNAQSTEEFDKQVKLMDREFQKKRQLLQDRLDARADERQQGQGGPVNQKEYLDFLSNSYDSLESEFKSLTDGAGIQSGNVYDILEGLPPEMRERGYELLRGMRDINNKISVLAGVAGVGQNEPSQQNQNQTQEPQGAQDGGNGWLNMGGRFLDWMFGRSEDQQPDNQTTDNQTATDNNFFRRNNLSR